MSAVGQAWMHAAQSAFDKLSAPEQTAVRLKHDSIHSWWEKTRTILFCPVCRERLVVTGKARLETLDEHVSDPNGTPALKIKYECSNEECATHKKLMWEEGGGMYHGWDTPYSEKFPFIDGNNAPFGSFERCTNVEVYKEDENFDLFKWWGGKVRVVYRYTSDNDGNILTRRRKYEIWVKERDKCYTHYISGWSVFWYMVRRFHSIFHRLRRVETNDQRARAYKELLECTTVRPHSSGWGRCLGRWYGALFLWVLTRFGFVSVLTQKGENV